MRAGGCGDLDVTFSLYEGRFKKGVRSGAVTAATVTIQKATNHRVVTFDVSESSVGIDKVFTNIYLDRGRLVM